MEREDLYAVLDLNNECTQGDLRLSYKNLVLKWHPDRFLEEIEKDEAKMKFQSIQRAYSVLSDSNKRLLYDVGAYDSDDDETGMADFINEMVTLMAQTQSTQGDESLEEFEELFQELLKDDVNQFKTRSSSSSCSQFSGTSTLVHCDDLSNSNDIPNKINGHDNYCCISSSKVGGPSTRFQAGNRRSKK
ncbi:Chaperone DnaJ-domain superfamily protein [Arabidopsis thaliana]|uniref:Chaperone DnaJ-domain superfamily protein n=1 Tax=Arabidopsis thaliana TaxID=3702 RepID=B3H5E7_ARATH|nr:Chaperone DnaJ-domain superfamily protein [Arabidopsis thaliana]AEE35321.1 Chaperone DnaJ-domain superfamily protein [Arabidopsis thaliana]|eukprot:NP_001117590.1 Chaperone DnaJ-domain superfamily protein [Arabidopsis thaliana]